MAILYKANETDFNHLGLGPLDDAVSILVTEERNGMFELEMSYPIEGTRINEIKLDRLIKADAGHNLKGQRFKIIRITKPIDGIVTINAEHVSYLTQDLALKPTVNYSGNASQALNTWKNSIVDINPFIVSSDIITNGSGSWSIKDVNNAREALGGVSGSILETYGGEYRFDNYSIRLMAQRGVNSGALIAYGRNLVDLTQEESIADTFTSVYPYAVYQDAKNKEVLLILPEYFVDSEYVGNYARRKILPVDFSEDEIKDVATLRSRTNSYIKSNGIGIPKVNMQIKYIDLAKTLDYKDLAILEEVNLCDNIFVYFEQLDVNTSAKIIKTVWDDLLEQYDSIEVGEAKSSLSNSINATVDGKLETIVQRVNTIQLTADGLNVIYRGPEQSAPGNIGDLWYEPDGIYENMYQWDGSIWKLMLSTRDLDSVSEEVKKHTDEIATVAKSANDAVAKADQAIIDAGFAQVDSNAAIINAGNAITIANTAKTNADTALTASQTAISNSGTALKNAQTALTAYNDLEIGGRNLILNSQYIKLDPNDSGWGDAVLQTDEDVPYYHVHGDSFISTYEYPTYLWMNENCIVGETYTIGVDVRLSTVGVIVLTEGTGNTKEIAKANVWTRIFHTFDYTQNFFAVVLDYQGTDYDYRNWKLENGNQGTSWTPAPEDVQVQITDINGELSRKVAQTTFDTLNGTVANQSTLISQSQTAIGLKADKTVVDTINSTVASHTLSIKATADSLATKAEKTLVDSINGTVAGHTSQIKVNADGLALKADSSFVNTVKGTVDTHTAQLKITSDGLALKAESSLVNTINGTVNNHTSQIGANSTAINAKLTSAQVDSLVVAKNYVNQTTLNATSSSLNASITQVSTDLNNLEIGGRNLLLNSKINLTSSVYNIKTFILSEPITENSKVTISIKGELGIDRSYFGLYNSGGNVSIASVTPAIRNSKGIYVLTFNWEVSTASNISLNIYQMTSNKTSNSTIEWAKLEYGDKNTDWSPAPEEMTTLEKFTTLNATVDGIQTTVGTKASQTQVTQLATQITTKVESSTYNSKMTQLDTAINLRVQSGDVTSAILADKTIKDTRSDNQLPSWYFANYPKQIVFEFKQRSVMGVTGSATYGQLETKVIWNGTSGGVVTQIFSSSDGVFQRQGNSQATTWLAWDKIAESGKLISQINISTEGILLQGKRIQLDGDVTMTTAFINNIKAIDISADRITAGTLNASNVNIINLNASKIATGTISGVNSTWNLNTGIQTFTNPTTGDMLKLNQGEIEFQNGIQTRYLKYNAEGLQLLPGSGNTGTSKNTSLHLIGGGVGSYQYIQFTSGDGIAQRVETVGHEMVLHHGTDGALHVRRYGQDDTTGKLIAAKYETRHATGKTLIIARDTIDTERSGSANIYIRPSGAGVLVSGNDAGERYNVVASDFVKQSTRTSKTDIKPIETKGLDVINRLLPVSYKKKDKIARGIIETELGFISEDNPEIATLDGLGVYDSHINAYLVKAVQELSEKIKLLESGI